MTLYRLVTHFEDGSTGDIWNLTAEETVTVITASLAPDVDRIALGFEVTAEVS